nr:hydantoinase B/oxoprolinase family protein [Methylomicrobium agile]
MIAGILSGRRMAAPFGLDGGKAGMPGINRVIRRDGTIEVVPGCAQIEMASGDQFQIETPGGGGCG